MSTGVPTGGGGGGCSCGHGFGSFGGGGGGGGKDIADSVAHENIEDKGVALIGANCIEIANLFVGACAHANVHTYDRHTRASAEI